MRFVKISSGTVIIFVGEYMNFCPCLPHLATDLGKFGTEVLHTISLNNRDFGENRRTKSHSLVKGVNDILNYFLLFMPFG